MHCDEVKEFIGAQRKLTEDVLSNCNLRGNFREKITNLFDFPRYGCPFRKGKKYFYFHNTGLQAQSVLYVQVCETLNQFCFPLAIVFNSYMYDMYVLKHTDAFVY